MVVSCSRDFFVLYIVDNLLMEVHFSLADTWEKSVLRLNSRSCSTDVAKISKIFFLCIFYIDISTTEKI